MSSAQATRISSAQRVERYFQVCLFFLLLTGFATLASTGRLDLFSVLLVGAAFAYRGYLLRRGVELVIPERWTSYLTLLYLAFYIFDFFFLSANFVTATVHLVLFVMVVKLFSTSRERDLLYLAVLSFLMVLAAAILTVDTMFLAMFCAFLLVAASTFVSLEMRRSLRRSAVVAPAGESRGRTARMESALSTTSAGIVVATVVVGAGVFFVLPRVSGGYLSAFAPRSSIVSGFSDSVNLGEIGRIQQSSQVVMHAQVLHGGGTEEIRWRGVALAIFDGKRWSAPSRRLTPLPRTTAGFQLNTRTPEEESQFRAQRVPGRMRLMRYRVVMEPIGTQIFFVADTPLSIIGNYRDLYQDETGAAYNYDRVRVISTYEGFSELPPPTSAAAAVSRDHPRSTSLTYLQLPALDSRVPELAARVTADSAHDLDRARRLELFLRSEFGYTLQLPPLTPDPLAHFLFERKQGHCEYFASAMAVMLRTLGIPSRMVTGFRGGELNPLTGSYIVRARDAHAWVEAYFPELGWIAFDPTPPSAMPERTAWDQAGLYLDAMREFWREWIINYDFAHQVSLGRQVNLKSREVAEDLRAWYRNKYRALLQKLRDRQQSLQTEPKRWLLGGLVLAAFLLIVLNLPRIVRAVRDSLIARRAAHMPHRASSVWFSRLLHFLSRRGLKRPPAQTPQEFAAAIGDPLLRDQVVRFVHHYERARYGDSVPDAEQLPHIYDEIVSK